MRPTAFAGGAGGAREGFGGGEVRGWEGGGVVARGYHAVGCLEGVAHWMMGGWVRLRCVL